jgi:hypothetical protein
MRKANLFLLSAAPLTVFAAAALAQQVMYSGQKPNPAVPYGQQGQQQQAMTYEQALAQQQAFRSGQNGEENNAPGASGGANSAGEAAPVAVDPDGNPIFGAVGTGESGTPAAAQPLAGNASRNEAQLEADRLRQDPAAVEQSQQASPQAPQDAAGGYAQQQPYPQQNQPQYGQPQAPPSQQAYAQPGYRQQPGYPQQAYPPQQGYAQQQPSDNVPDQGYGYAQPAPRPPVVAASPYGAYPAPVPPPVVAYGYPYPYGYPYGYGVGIRIGGFYGGGYYRGGYGFRGGYVGRGYAGGFHGGYARGGRR